MSIQSDIWISYMAKEHDMIFPFEENQIKNIGNKKVVSYGLSSYGYDLRVSNEFKIFTNVLNFCSFCEFSLFSTILFLLYKINSTI